MMEADGFAFATAAESALLPPVVTDVASMCLNERLLCSVSADGSRMQGPVGNVSAGSGGFIEFVFRAAARALFGVEVAEGPLPFVKGRNPDFEELFLEVIGGITMLFFSFL
jgi:hypothetical protein